MNMIGRLFLTTALGGTMFAGCQTWPERPFHGVDGKNQFKTAVDSISKETQEALKNDATLECFYTDTVEFTPEIVKNPKPFLEVIKYKATKKIPKVATGTIESGYFSDAQDVKMEKYTRESITPVIKGLFKTKLLKEAPKLNNVNHMDTIGTKLYLAVAAYGKRAI